MRYQREIETLRCRWRGRKVCTFGFFGAVRRRFSSIGGRLRDWSRFASRFSVFNRFAVGCVASCRPAGFKVGERYERLLHLCHLRVWRALTRSAPLRPPGCLGHEDAWKTRSIHRYTRGTYTNSRFLYLNDDIGVVRAYAILCRVTTCWTEKMWQCELWTGTGANPKNLNNFMWSLTIKN